MPRVLIVEDEPGARSAMVRLCQVFGLEPVGVATVAAAMAELSGVPPDFIVLDLMLPDGNGAEVLHRVRSNNLACRVTVATGASDPTMLAAVRALGPERLMIKPIDFPALRDWFKSHTPA